MSISAGETVAPVNGPLKALSEVASALGLQPGEFEPYGLSKGKINLSVLPRVSGNPTGKLVLVTTMTPTPFGEGKTTTTIGIADAFRKVGVKSMICLREPSMGPCFGVKGGATGGGMSRVLPSDDINLHFTGDLHAVTSAHNLLATVIDNHLHHGNDLKLDPRRISIRRVMDMNDRSIRHVVIGLGGPVNGVPRETGFDITASSEVMAILCLAENLKDLRERLGNIIIGFNTENRPVFARELQIHGAMTALLKDAMKPNLVQSAAGTPAFIHGGPFANIAHGCNSLVATKLALKLADVVVTEAGFATDLGAEKFFDIKCRIGGLEPDAVILIATVRSLKHHGGMAKADLTKKGMAELAKGFENLAKHIENIQFFGIPCVVAINKFGSDTEEELQWLHEAVTATGIPVALSEVFEKGAVGGEKVAALVQDQFQEKRKLDFLYPLEMPLIEKMNVIARCCYGADGVDVLKSARDSLDFFEKLGYRKFPICMAKTQSSLSDIPNLLARPRGFKITIREARLAAGAGFVIGLAGDIMTMPGLPKIPSALNVDVDDSGNITGLT